MMKKALFISFLMLSIMQLSAQSTVNKQTEVLLETTEGNIRIALFNDTPQHRDNFIKLVREKYYDGLLFHRTIKNFMIQTGDPNSREAAPGDWLGEGGPEYTIPAEIHFPERFHHKGVLAMAREADAVNPQRASSGSQFFIIVGRTFTKSQLREVQHMLDNITEETVKLTEKQKMVYREEGGSPHLDGQYTIFGEVIEGMDTVMEIQKKKTDINDRPKEDVRIIKATIIE